MILHRTHLIDTLFPILLRDQTQVQKIHSAIVSAMPPHARMHGTCCRFPRKSFPLFEYRNSFFGCPPARTVGFREPVTLSVLWLVPKWCLYKFPVPPFA